MADPRWRTTISNFKFSCVLLLFLAVQVQVQVFPCDVIIGRRESKLGVGLLCTEMIIVCKFHDPSNIDSRDKEGGPRSPPPPHP